MKNEFEIVGMLESQKIKPRDSLPNKLIEKIDAIEFALASGYTIKQVSEILGYEYKLFNNALFRARKKIIKQKKLAVAVDNDSPPKKNRAASAAETYPKSSTIADDLGEPVTAKKKSKITFGADLDKEFEAQAAKFK